MPIRIPNDLPAHAVLESENIFTMDESRAEHQDIRPLRILIFNLMPIKCVTETQILRCLSNTPLQIEIDLLQASTHVSKNTPQEHLLKFYKTFDEIIKFKYDGMIITGAPVEHLPFEQVDYWDELCMIMEWSKTHVFSVFHICWGAQAGLYYHYGINKHTLDSKVSGIFLHKAFFPKENIFRGFDDYFYAPHSRHTEIDEDSLLKENRLLLLSSSDEVGPYIIASVDRRQFFVLGHCEYDKDTLANEYFRDIKAGIDAPIPKHYFINDDPANDTIVNWRSHGQLLFTNWLNYYVYQTTPFDLDKIQQKE